MRESDQTGTRNSRNCSPQFRGMCTHTFLQQPPIQSMPTATSLHAKNLPTKDDSRK